MDEDGKLPEGLRLPESLAESGDPVEGNPYPIEHPAHQVWMDATRQAETEVSRINSEASSSLTPATADDVDADAGRRQVRRVGQTRRAGCLDG